MQDDKLVNTHHMPPRPSSEAETDNRFPGMNFA